jgi:hypothetical protein
MINDEQLLLYHYHDGLSASARAQIQAQLMADPSVAARYQRLCDQLAELPAAETPTADAAALARWRASLTRAAQAAAEPSSRPWWPMALAGATLMLLGVAIGTRLAESDRIPSATPQLAAASTAEDGDALTRGLSSHFGDARLLLAELPDEDPAQRQALIANIVEQNRMYQQAAQAQGDERLVRVLRSLEPVLLALAADGSGSEDARSARAQLDFEFAVMQTKLSRSPSKTVQSL